MNNNQDINLEMLIESAKKLSKRDRAKLIESLKDMDTSDSPGSSEENEPDPENYSKKFKLLTGYEKLSVVFEKIGTVDLTVHIQNADKEEISSAAKVVCDRVRSDE